MARAELYLEDEGAGIAVVARHLGGFDERSKAHKMANQLVKYLDGHADWKKDEIVEVVDPSSPLLTSERPGLIHL